jgi:hypothetical protein
VTLFKWESWNSRFSHDESDREDVLCSVALAACACAQVPLSGWGRDYVSTLKKPEERLTKRADALLASLILNKIDSQLSTWVATCMKTAHSNDSDTCSEKQKEKRDGVFMGR